MDEFFDVAGHWTVKPLAWDTPENILKHKQFLGVLQQITGQISLAFYDARCA